MGFLSSILALFITAQPQTIVYAQKENVIILDVRTDQEYKSSHLKGAINIDFYQPDFKSQISKLDKTKTYLIYCRSGNRSGQTLNIMKNLGFTNLENLGGLSQAAKRLNLSCDNGKSC